MEWGGPHAAPPACCPACALRHPRRPAPRRPRALQVVAAKVPYLSSWNGSKTMLGALTELKALISRASRAQPPDGANY